MYKSITHKNCRGQSFIEYVLIFALVAVAIVAGGGKLLEDLRCQQVPQAFCRSVKAMLGGDTEVCSTVNACTANGSTGGS